MAWEESPVKLRLLGVALMAMGLTSAQPQSAAPQPVFAAASIKKDTGPERAGILRPTPGTVTGENVSVLSYIRWAWNVKDYQISVPGALQAAADSHYDIAAKADGPEPLDGLRLMLRSLLAERFHLAVHFEKRDIPVFALVVGKDGPKQLHDPAPGNVPHMEPDSGKQEGGQRWLFYSLPVSAVIGIMSNGLSRPFVDMTEIKGSFDYTFVLPPWNKEEGPLGEHVMSNVFPELQRQLGLRAVQRTASLDVLVVDHIDKSPTEN
jgi:uncharacterized protein (TIGR03435 family)